MRHLRITACRIGLCCLAFLCLTCLTGLARAEAESPARKSKATRTATTKRTEQPEEQSAAKPAAAKPADAKPAAAAEKKEQTAKPDAAEKKTASDKKVAATTKKEPAKASVVRLTLHGEFPERTPAAGLFGDMQPSLRTVLLRLEQAADDKDVAAVILSIEDLEIGGGKVFELREGIARYRKSGKPIYAEIASGSTAEYLVACACDEVIMPPSGVLLLPGVRAEMTFYKGMLDKLGIKFDMLQQGKFKGAGEPYTRTSMSPAFRQSIEAVVDDSYDALAKTVAGYRKIPDHQVKTHIDRGLFTAAAAKKAGLIDQIVYADQIEETIRRKLKVEKLNVVTNYRKKQVDADFSGIGGMIKLMELMFGGDKKAERSSGLKRVAVVYAVGPIMEEKSGTSMFGDEMVLSTTVISALRTAADDPRVVAVVLRIDSPGGSAIASDLIWREIVRLKKPVIASMGDVAASGGYYIAMGAKKIIAEPSTITGSIGVIGGKPVVRGLLDKIGVSTEIISRGQNSGALSLLDPFSPSERESWVAMMEDIYGQFVGKAAQGRKMPRQKVEELAQGRIYTGRMAVANGLVDRLGTLHDAVIEAKKAGGLGADEKVELLVLPKPRSFFEQLMGDPASLNTSLHVSLAEQLDLSLPEARRALRQLSVLKRLASEPTLLLMPCDIRVR